MAIVFTGLSGGVDSAVSAALLKEQGHTVIGAFIKIWQPEFTECTWREDRLDAMRVAAHLKIPFLEVDLSDAYKNEVVAGMIEDYRRGITPNPDVLCNNKIKFGHFAAWARSHGAEIIATGHYARIRAARGRVQLLRGADREKDQSYFLYRLAESDLQRTFFPVGELRKSEVRREAVRHGLPIAAKPDSQGLCFIGEVSMRDFLARYIDVEEGPVLDVEGNIIGRHDGAALYTVGQRHGFEVHGRTEPHYIAKIDIGANAITVSPRRRDAERLSIPLEAIHWMGEAPSLPVTASLQVRYREPEVRGEIYEDGGLPMARLETPRVASRGQSLVIYDNGICLGGAVMR